MSLMTSLRRGVVAVAATALLIAPVSPVANAQLSSGMGSSSSTPFAYPGITPDETFPLAVGDREVLVSLPENYDPAVAYPVILAFGGLGVSPEVMAGDTGLQNAADAIVAYGRGLGDTWAGAPYSQATMDEDIAYSRAVVEAVAAVHTVDRSRIYAVGHSNGGAFAVGLACRAPDLVAGAVSVSGMFYQGIDGSCVGDPVPVMLIHSVDDGIARPEGGIWRDTPFDATSQVLENWRQRNGCEPVTEYRFTSAPDATHQAWRSCLADTEYLLSQSAGHQWPHHAPFEAWDFLSRQFR